MSVDLIGVYKFIIDNPFDFSPEAQISDLAVGIADKNNIPIGWTTMLNSFNTPGLTDFENLLIPTLLVAIGGLVTDRCQYERVPLKLNQVWYPTISCNTYASKTITHIKPKEIGYKQPGIKAFCQPESFIEWIIFTGASLVDTRKDNKG